MQHAPKRLVDLVEVRGSNGMLPPVESLSPYSVKATPSDFGDIDQHGKTDPYVPRTRNDVDVRVRSALSSGRLVVVIGPSKAGKTRTLFEAVRHEMPSALMAVPDPSTAASIADCPEYANGSQTVVVWLENLDQFTRGSERLTPLVLARLTARPGRTVVVATLRSEKYDELNAGGELSDEVRTLLEQARRIELEPTSEDPTEQAAAQSLYPTMDLSRYGLAEMLAGAPALLRLYRRGGDRRGVTEQVAAYCVVVQVVIDWARIGFVGGVPHDRLLELARRRADTRYPAYDITDAHLNSAIAEARRPQEGTGHTTAIEVTTVTGCRDRSYKPFDYLVAADDTNNFRAIPEEFWHDATDGTDPPTLAHRVGISAYNRGLLGVAEAVFRRAVSAGHAGGMLNLGLLLRDRGDLDEAETWYRTAADSGHTGAMYFLGRLLQDRGDLDKAETWYRTAVNNGDTGAMYFLGRLLQDRGDLDKAETWYRTAADSGDIGDTGAMIALGLLLRDRGDLDKAETWFRTAADTGHTGAMYFQVHLL
ncbi:tetratricopeptide repeat protein [Nocardia sp. NPDC055321]